MRVPEIVAVVTSSRSRLSGTFQTLRCLSQVPKAPKAPKAPTAPKVPRARRETPETRALLVRLFCTCSVCSCLRRLNLVVHSR